jgi:hypothetical protein
LQQPYPDQSDLVNHNGQTIVNELVLWDGRRWRLKLGAGWRDALAYLLGRQRVNVARSVLAGEPVDATWPDGSRFSETTAPLASLICLIQDHRLEDLATPDPDSSLAGELVFSLWVRRRDAHPWNRAYVNGLPGFFDHHIAFGAEAENTTIDGFFRDGGDAGYVSRWRIRQFPAGTIPTTASERSLEPTDLALHRVHDINSFDSKLDAAVKSVVAFDPGSFEELARATGCPAPAEVSALLSRTQQELHDSVERLRKFAYDV